MRLRSYWLQHIFSTWKKSSVIWLSGVRHVGKSSLSTMIPGVVHVDCNLPDHRGSLTEPEPFFKNLPKGTAVLDEFHRLLFPEKFLREGLKTGKSMLLATNVSPDLVTRYSAKPHPELKMLYLPPVMWDECFSTFEIKDLDRRLFHGGLPKALLEDEYSPTFYSDWIDNYYAGDIQNHFEIRSRDGFFGLLRVILRQSGDLLDLSDLSRKAGLCRPTVRNYVEAMTSTHAIYQIPPFHGTKPDELSRSHRYYAFDTGFVGFASGWRWLRREDRDRLWRHLVLDCLRVYTPEQIYHWQTKSGQRLDLILPRAGGTIDTFHCHTSFSDINARSLKSFRRRYPLGENFLVMPEVDDKEMHREGKVEYHIIDVKGLRDLLV